MNPVFENSAHFNQIDSTIKCSLQAEHWGLANTEY